MKIIFEELKKGVVKVKVENLDDLWYLSQIIEKDDFVEGETFRKIKIGGAEEATDVAKKRVFLKIKAEKIEFAEYSNALRVSGVITEAPEDIPKGMYHTFNVEEQSIIKIIKPKWLKFQETRLREAAKGEQTRILICVFDREEAIIAKMKRYGFDILVKISGQVQKKAVEQQEKNFYQEIIKIVEEYDKREDYSNIIFASPSFFKEYLVKEIKNDALKKKTVFATCSGVSESSISEVIKRDELKTVLSSQRAAKELSLVENLLLSISRNDLGVYGLKEVKNASELGAVEELLVTDKLIHKSREEHSFHKIEEIMKIVESSRGVVHILSSEHDGGRKLDGLGGIAGILRYKLQY